MSCSAELLSRSNVLKLKEEQLKMRVNDLESQITHKYREKLAALQKLTKSYQRNLDLALAKYNSLRQSQIQPKLKQQQHAHSFQNKNEPEQKSFSRKLQTLLSDSSERISFNVNNSVNMTQPAPDTQQSEIKEERLHHLKHENVQLKQSLEGIRKKFEGVVKENDDLKTVSNRTTYAYQVFCSFSVLNYRTRHRLRCVT